MQLQIKKSGRFTYLYAIKGYRTDSGKSTTKVVRKFGTVEELRTTLDEDPIEWARKQVKEMTMLEKEELKSVTYEFNPALLLTKAHR
ncbi:hypothetical protein EVA_21047, partial [gut metagenome]